MYNISIFTLPAGSGYAASLLLQTIRLIKYSVVCIYATEAVY